MALPGVSIAPALAADRHLTVAAFGGGFEKMLRSQVLPGFTQATGTSVALEIGVGSVFIPKMVAAGSRPVYDVVYINDDEAYFGQEMGLWAPDVSSRLKNAGALYPALQPSHVPLYCSVIYNFPLLYRPEKLAKPTSWEDLWRPGITVAVPHISNSYGVTFLYIAALLNGGSEKNFDPGFAAIKRLKNKKIYKGVTEGFSLFQQGEVDAGPFYNHRAQQLKDQGVNVAWAYPKEGVWGQRTGCQIPKNSSNKDLAAQWIDTTLGVPYQTAFAQELYSPSNRQVKLPPQQQSKILSGDAVIDGLRFPDWSIINPQRDDLMARWTKEFANG